MTSHTAPLSVINIVPGKTHTHTHNTGNTGNTGWGQARMKPSGAKLAMLPEMLSTLCFEGPDEAWRALQGFEENAL